MVQLTRRFAGIYKPPTLLFKFTMCQRKGRAIKSQALGARPQGSGPLQMSPQKAGRQLLGAEQTLLFGWKSAFDFWAAPRACCCWAPTSAGGSRRAMRCSGGAVGFIFSPASSQEQLEEQGCLFLFLSFPTHVLFSGVRPYSFVLSFLQRRRPGPPPNFARQN